MAKRKKKNKAGGAGIVFALVALAVIYASGRFGNNIAEDGEKETAKAVEQTVEVEEESPSIRTNTVNQRAKGLEIPAYLTDRDEEIVIHEGFTLSYNKKHLVPNWVAWVLTPERVQGNIKRINDFQPDSSIVHGPIAQLSDYRGSGYDRGHMCPSADNKHSQDAMKQCFLLSNMCPQTHKLNADDWKQLENLCRKWAVEYDSIYIVCGPIIEKGETYETIGENEVTVPKQFYKVVLRWTGDNSAEAIGFIMNNDTLSFPIHTSAVTVDSVEVRTGINFFSKFPKDVERRAEAQFDCSKWKNLQK